MIDRPVECPTRRSDAAAQLPWSIVPKTSSTLSRNNPPSSLTQSYLRDIDQGQMSTAACHEKQAPNNCVCTAEEFTISRLVGMYFATINSTSVRMFPSHAFDYFVHSKEKTENEQMVSHDGGGFGICRSSVHHCRSKICGEGQRVVLR